MTFRLWIGDEDYGTAAESQARAWLAYHTRTYPLEPARIEEVADDAPVFLPKDDDPRVFEPLAPGHPAIWEPCGLCGVTFIAGDVTMLVPKEQWAARASDPHSAVRKPGSGMTVEGALVHRRCYETARRVLGHRALSALDSFMLPKKPPLD